jgi:hypothetical protein
MAAVLNALTALRNALIILPIVLFAIVFVAPLVIALEGSSRLFGLLPEVAQNALRTLFRRGMRLLLVAGVLFVIYPGSAS